MSSVRHRKPKKGDHILAALPGMGNRAGYAIILFYQDGELFQHWIQQDDMSGDMLMLFSVALSASQSFTAAASRLLKLPVVS